MDLADVARTNPSRYWGSKMKRPHIAKLIEIPGRDPFFIQSLDALVDRDIQFEPSREITENVELSGVRVIENCLKGNENCFELRFEL